MAASDSKATAFWGVAHRITFPILDADGDLVTAAASLDSEVSKDGGTFADCTNEATEIATGSGVYYLDLTATEMEADQIAVIVKTATAGAKTTTIVIYPEQGIRTRKAQAGAAGTITLDASASATDDFYNDCVVAIVGGTGVGQARLISNYTGSSKVADVVPNWATNPDSTSIFHIIRSGRVDVGQWVDVAPNALVSGRVDSSVGAMAADTVTASAIATGAIDADSLAADAITAAKIANGAIDAATFAAGAIDATAIANGAIDAPTFASGAIDAAAIATGAIDADSLAASAVDKINQAASGTADAGGSTTTIVDTERTEADTDYWKGSVVLITSGSAIGQVRRITAFNAATDTITVSPAFTQSIGAGVTYIILRNAVAEVLVDAVKAGAIDAAAIATDAIDSDAVAASAVTEIQSGLATAAALSTVQADTDDIQTRLPATLSGGRMRSQVEGMDAGTVTSAAVATGAVDADALASDAVEKILRSVSGTADSTTVTTVVDAERTEADTDYWKDAIIVFTAGPAVHQPRRVSAFNPATDTLTVDTAWTTSPGANTYIILRTAMQQAAAGGSGDWTAGEKEQIRDRLGIDGTKTAPAVTSHPSLRALASGTADSGSTTTVVDAARTEADTDYWKGCWILFVSGTLAGQVRLITAFNAATDTITFAPAATQAVATHEYEILPAGAVDLRLWTGSAPNALVSGRVDAIAGAIAAGAVDAAAIATDAIDSDAIAASAVTEIQAGLATAASLSTVQADTDDIQARLPAALVGGRMASNAEVVGDKTGYSLTGAEEDAITNKIWDELTAEARTAGSYGQLFKDRIDAAIGTRATPAQVNAEVVDALTVDTVSELAQAQPPVSPTIAQAIMMLYMAMRNNGQATSSERRIRNDAGVTIAKAPLSDDGVTFSQGKLVTGP